MSSRNPLEWPIVEHNRYLVQAVNPTTAYVMHGWPFGNVMRSVKRVWANPGSTTANGNQWQLLSQVTTKAYNARYTEVFESMPPGFPNRALLDTNYSVIQRETSKPYWSKPSESPYQLFACWEEVMCKEYEDMADNLATMAARPFALTINSTPAELMLFLDYVFGYNELLSAQQIISLRRIEVIGRRYSPSTWEEPIKWKAWGLE